jgi:hypothetical protein
MTRPEPVLVVWGHGGPVARLVSAGDYTATVEWWEWDDDDEDWVRCEAEGLVEQLYRCEPLRAVSGGAVEAACWRCGEQFARPFEGDPNEVRCECPVCAAEWNWLRRGPLWLHLVT